VQHSVDARYRPLQALELSELIARAGAAAKERPSNLETMLQCWAEATARHAPLGKMMALQALFERVKIPKPERFASRSVTPADWFLDAYAAARSLPKGRATRGTYQVYVLLLRGVPGSPDDLGLYVGESHLDGAARLAQHLAGINHARVVQRFGIAALPSFCPQLTKLSRKDSRRLEAELAARLKDVMRRYRLSDVHVQGGH